MLSLLARKTVAHAFEAGFDLSLALYSHLQASGFEQEAQYAVLMGHKTRWSLSGDLIALQKFNCLVSSQPQLKILADKLADSVNSVHPIIWSVAFGQVLLRQLD